MIFTLFRDSSSGAAQGLEEAIEREMSEALDTLEHECYPMQRFGFG